MNKVVLYYAANTISAIVIIINLILLNTKNAPHAFDIDFIVWLLLAFAFGLYNISPYLLEMHIMRKHADSTLKLIAHIIIIIISAIIGINDIYSIVTLGDAQSGVMLLVVPVKLFIFVIVSEIFLAVLSKMFDMKSKQKKIK